MSAALGDMIRIARTAKRMTLRKLAVSIGVSAPYMSDVEHNRRRLSEERIRQVAKLLDLNVTEMMIANGLSRDLIAWIRDNPELQDLLRTARDTDRPVVIGGDTCPCCGRRWCP